MNWRTRGFIFWCHEQVIDVYFDVFERERNQNLLSKENHLEWKFSLKKIFSQPDLTLTVFSTVPSLLPHNHHYVSTKWRHLPISDLSPKSQTCWHFVSSSFQNYKAFSYENNKYVKLSFRWIKTEGLCWWLSLWFL